MRRLSQIFATAIKSICDGRRKKSEKLLRVMTEHIRENNHEYAATNYVQSI
jgi:hypothetical protein